MSYSVTITDKADEDLRSIFEYIAFDLHSRINAARQINRLEEAITSLSEMPKRFSLYGNEPWRSRGLRMMPVDNYCVLYIACDDTLSVEILRVMYGGRNIKQIMDEYSEENRNGEK